MLNAAVLYYDLTLSVPTTGRVIRKVPVTDQNYKHTATRFIIHKCKKMSEKNTALLRAILIIVTLIQPHYEPLLSQCHIYTLHRYAIPIT